MDGLGHDDVRHVPHARLYLRCGRGGAISRGGARRWAARGVALGGLLFLVGKNRVIARRNGMSGDQIFERALALFMQAATPQAGATKNPSVMLYDNLAAGYLGYFYLGKPYRGHSLVSATPALAQQYGMGCNGAGPAVPQLFEFCGMIDAVGRFNSSSDPTARQAAWSCIQQ